MKVFAAAVMMILGLSTTVHAEWRYGVQVGYSPNYLAKLSGDGTVSGTPTDIDYDLEYKGALEVGFNAWYTPQHSWGFISGISLGGERELDKMTLNGVTYSATGETSKFQTHFLYAGTLYRWESFYLPLGLAYGINKFTPAGTGDGEATNGVGILFGLGWFFADNFVIEYIGRSTTTELKLSSGTDTIKTKGAIGSALLNLKYFF
ncbi:hypothetical protein ACES2I_14480 [Bdellovibrio bacteriovorus]|uniref:hypothetical protein n=1 Tax=Bdellovibrio bacteriovorus TaxID=959 RepID=UPI0035A61AD6